MAESVASILANHNDTPATSFNTASVAPTTGLAYLLWVATALTGSTPPDATVTGQSLTWTHLATATCSTDTGARKQIQLFKGVGTPSTGALTISFGSTTVTWCAWNELTASDVDTTNPCVVTNIVTNFSNTAGTSGAVTLGSAANAANRPVSCFTHGGAEAATPATSWSELADIPCGAISASAETQWRSDQFDTAAAASWATSSKWAGIAAELAVLVATPVNTVAPAVTGTPTEGSTLSCDTGTWTG